MKQISIIDFKMLTYISIKVFNWSWHKQVQFNPDLIGENTEYFLCEMVADAKDNGKESTVNRALDGRTYPG